MATSRVCSIPDCGKREHALKLCGTHYRLHHRARDTRTCEEVGCNKRVTARGRCYTHYIRLLETAGRVVMPSPGACLVEGCDAPYEAKGYCAHHYRSLRRHGDPLAPKLAPRGAGLAFIEDVLAREPTDECILWPYPYRGKSRGCYAHITVNNKLWPAHRYVCHRAHGPEPKPRMETCHSCANKRCVNPKHLRWGTQAENGADRVQHGTVCRGEAQWSAKLTEDSVREIKALLGSTSDAELGKRFGVTSTNINYIRSGKTWRHVA